MATDWTYLQCSNLILVYQCCENITPVQLSTKALGNMPSLPLSRPRLHSVSICWLIRMQSPCWKDKSPSELPAKSYRATTHSTLGWDACRERAGRERRRYSYWCTIFTWNKPLIFLVLQDTLDLLQSQHRPFWCLCLYKYWLPEQVWPLQGVHLEKQPCLWEKMADRLVKMKCMYHLIREQIKKCLRSYGQFVYMLKFNI